MAKPIAIHAGVLLVTCMSLAVLGQTQTPPSTPTKNPPSVAQPKSRDVQKPKDAAQPSPWQVVDKVSDSELNGPRNTVAHRSQATAKPADKKKAADKNSTKKKDSAQK